jgi:hypothetical protein
MSAITWQLSLDHAQALLALLNEAREAGVGDNDEAVEALLTTSISELVMLLQQRAWHEAALQPALVQVA